MNPKTSANSTTSGAQLNTNHQSRMRRSRPVIAIDKIRAVARPDQLVPADVMPLVVTTEEADLQFNLENDPVIQAAVHQQGNNPPNQLEKSQVSGRIAAGHHVSTSPCDQGVSKDTTNTTENQGIDVASDMSLSDDSVSRQRDDTGPHRATCPKANNERHQARGQHSKESNGPLVDKMPLDQQAASASSTEPSLTDEEEFLLAKVDDEITAAEEKELLERIDDEITAAEEEELLKKVEAEIEEAERRAYRKGNTGSLVTHVCSAQDLSNSEPNNNWKEAEENRAALVASNRDTASIIRNDRKKRSTLVDQVSQRRFIRGQKTVPKFLPGSKQPFLTRESLQVALIAPFIKEQKLQGKLAPRDLEEFIGKVRDARTAPDSLRLAVVGRPKVVELFRECLKAWLDNQFLKHKIEKLLSDPFSVEFELLFDAASAKVAVADLVLNEHPYGKFPGIWFERPSFSNEICKRIGRKAMASGKALVRVNGEQCSKAKGVLRFISRQTATTIALTICIDKYADFSQLYLAKGDKVHFANGQVFSQKQIKQLQNRKLTIPKHEPHVKYSTRTTPSPSQTKRVLNKDAAASLLAAGTSLQPPIVPPNTRDVRTRRSPSPSQKKTILNQDTAANLLAAEPSIHPPIVLSSTHDKSNAAGPSSNAGYKPTDSLGYVNYFNFDRKLKSARDIEYKGTEIQSSFASGQMWAQHRTRFGADCPDECQCVFHFGFLTATVVPNYVLKCDRKKKQVISRSLRKGQSPRGFMDCFAPKFMPLLQKEFPTEKPVQLLQRLVDMWPDHQSQRNFGLECRRNCTCREGWKLVFNLGRPKASKRLNETSYDHQNKRKKESLEDTDASIRRKKATDATMQNSNVDRGNSFAKGTTASIPRTMPPAGHHTPGDHYTATPLAAGVEENLLQRPIKRKKLTNPVQSLETRPIQRKATEELRRSHYGPAEHTDSGSSKKRKNSSEAQGSKKDSQKSFMTSYDVTYKSSQPLGLYCITDNKGSKRTVCKVHSVCPVGQTQDQRVQKGTTIESAEMLLEGLKMKVSIPDHGKLQAVYKEAQTTGSDLKLWFINSDVKSTSLRMGKDWTSEGLCRIIKTPRGWAGGAEIVSPHVSESSAAQTAEDEMDLDNNDQESRKPAPVGPAPQPEVEQLDVVESKQARHREKSAPKSILRLKANKNNTYRPRTRGVHFLDENAFSKRVFFIGSSSTEQFVSSMVSSSQTQTVASATATASIEEPAIQDLKTAIHEGTYDDVVRLLDAGAATTQLSSLQDLDKELVLLKSELHALKSTKNFQITDPLRAIEREKELERKKVVLKIYLHAHNVIENARYMKFWVRYEVWVEEIFDFRLSEFGRLHSTMQDFVGKVSTITRTTLSQAAPIEMNLPELPRMKIGEFAAYNGPNGRPEYVLSQCQGLRSEERELKIELFGLQSSSQISLGTLTLNFDEFAHATERTPNSVVLKNFAPGPLMESAKVRICVNRVAIPRNYINDKIRKNVDRIKTIVEWISTFNEDIKKSGEAGRTRVTGDIRGNENVSLLHAAINHHYPEGVQELMNLGADPRAKSAIGSPMELAMNLLDRTAEKAGDRHQEAYQHLLADYTKIVKFLKGDVDEIGQNQNNTEIGQNQKKNLGKEQISSHAAILETNRTAGHASVAESSNEPHGTYSNDRNDPLNSYASLGQRETSQSYDSHSNESRNHTNTKSLTSSLPVSNRHDTTGATSSSYASLSKHNSTDGDVPPGDFRHHSHGAIKNPGRDDRSHSMHSRGWSLPRVERPYWFGKPPKIAPCIFFSKDSCNRGKHCTYLHIHPPLGKRALHRQYDEHLGKLFDPDQVNYLEMNDSLGRKWTTAVYHDKKNDVHYNTEGGNIAQRNDQGIEWFGSRQEALDSLRQVYKAAMYRKKQLIPSSWYKR